VSLAVYVTGHGFGHASRTVEILDALAARQPGIEIHVRTSAPRWFFDLTARARITLHPAACDTGVVQLDSLRPDIPATIAAAAAFYADTSALVAREAAWLSAVGARLVLADLPPLAIAAASHAGVPAIGCGNFTWDWIYEGYRDHLGEAAWLPAHLAGLQRSAAAGWRLPMHGGFDSYGRMLDLPFVARHARHAGPDVRGALDVARDRPLVLVSFGGFGLENLPLGRVAAAGDWTILTTDLPGRPRTGRQITHRLDNRVVVLDEQALYAAGLRYEDAVAAADVVVTKPGYGILAEAIANDTAVLYTSRGAFAEYDVLVREMPRFLRCRFIDPGALRAGDWGGPLEALLAQPPPPERPRTDGAAVAADLLETLLG
jgi:L-arabinokinase